MTTRNELASRVPLFVLNDIDRFCHFELQKISDVDPAITFVNEFDRFRHFELQNKSDVDLAITF